MRRGDALDRARRVAAVSAATNLALTCIGSHFVVSSSRDLVGRALLR